MKNSKIVCIVAISIGIAACKTIEHRESALDSKRMEMESIINKYKPMAGSGVTINWEGFHKTFSDDALVERIDLAKYEDCVSSFINTSNYQATIMKESGCETLFEQSKAYSGREMLDFREKNSTAFQRCDSLNNMLMTEFMGEPMRPCRELMELVNDSAPAPPRKKQ